MFKTEIAQLDMKEKKMSTQQQTIFFVCSVLTKTICWNYIIQGPS